MSSAMPPHRFLRYDLELALLEGRSVGGGASSRLGTGSHEGAAGPRACRLTPRVASKTSIGARDCLAIFPSYALGHLISAPAGRGDGAGDRPERSVRGRRRGRETCRQWLGRHGSPPRALASASEELVERVCGKPLGREVFLSYLANEAERLAAWDFDRNPPSATLALAPWEHRPSPSRTMLNLPCPPRFAGHFRGPDEARAAVSTRIVEPQLHTINKYELITGNRPSQARSPSAYSSLAYPFALRLHSRTWTKTVDPLDIEIVSVTEGVWCQAPGGGSIHRHSLTFDDGGEVATR